MYEKIRIKASLSSPIILRGFLTFDALLGALLFEKFEDVEKTHNAIPILSENGLFHASAAQLEPVASQPLLMVANLRADHTLNPDLIKKNRDGTKLHRKLGRKRRQHFGAVLNSYRAITTTSVSWDVVGDAEKISALVKRTYFIGTKRSSGYGEVSQWDISSGTNDGLIGIDKQPLRPIPVDQFTGDTSLPMIDTAWKPAYWDPENRAMCYAPELVT